jgi:hypothetical protein
MWAHDTWRGIEDDAYREKAERDPARFDDPDTRLDEIRAGDFHEA